MYAIVVEGAKQLRVSKGDTVRIDQLGLEPGTKVSLGRVLLVDDGSNVKVGAPTVSGASVQAEVVREIKGEKTWAFTYRRRKAKSKAKKGHRQRYTLVKITSVNG